MTGSFRSSPLTEKNLRLDVFDNFPCGEGELSSLILNFGISTGHLRHVADIGGGANPLFGSTLIKENRIEYSLLDISRSELDKAPAYYKKIQVDATAPLDEFCASVGTEKFDLVFSQCFLEHVEDPLRVHQNIYAILTPGGVAVHLYPSPNCFPLVINRLLPERISQRLLRAAQPERDLDGKQRKFPAFYAMCGAPSLSLEKKYKKLGYNIVRHTGYIGHGYYDRIPIVRAIERACRSILCRAGIPLISRAILVLQKPPIEGI